MTNKRAGAAEISAAAGSRGSGGRPTREEALQRDERLIEVATALFMERGFEGTSIDAVAEAARVSKPTVYARYRDKRELFATVLRGRIERWLAPLSAAAEAQVDEAGPKNLETILHDLSREMLALAMAPGAAALHRVLAAEALHFPDLAKLGYEEGWLRGVGCVPINFLMEDAATAEVSRSQLWQWVRHNVSTAEGKRVDKAYALRLLQEQADSLASQGPKGNKYQLAARYFAGQVTGEDYADFLTSLLYNEISSAGSAAKL